ncbi:hypothetical protein HMPREF9430_00522 [Solobacterium moorei F0204]|uniref:Uncharacterized protein n=1 Tax=Solobacterium moorei F0204 TaxID=706433 RepID=E7MLV9_9FIRM|nr:hypothetical protein HMPREF9430_00522 [Solobacterium moorei F0204]
MLVLLWAGIFLYVMTENAERRMLYHMKKLVQVICDLLFSMMIGCSLATVSKKMRRSM